MNEDSIQLAFAPYLPYMFAGLLVLIVWAVVNAQQRWNRIATPFRTRTKIKEDDYTVIHIDGRQFRKVIVVPLEEGLYLSQWPLLARVFLPKRVLIPWRNLSDMQVMPRTVIGLSYNEYFVTVSGAQKVQLKIPKQVAEEILEKNFLKQA